MTENLAYDPQTLFDEIVEHGRAAGVTDREAYDALVDDVVQEHLQVGEFDEDNELPDLTTQLKGRFADYQSALGLEGERPQL